MEPFLLKPSCKDSIWGGTKLKKRFHKEHSVDIISESWELSVHPAGLSLAASGPNRSVPLAELIKNPAVTGNFAASFTVFPLMIKWIDSQLPLSIQVHPDNDYAMAHEQDMGKTEMWYLVGADRDAELIMGFNKDTDKSEYLTALHNHTLPVLLNTEKVEKGDCFFIPAGTVHAICKGCYIAEIQQTSDITYRIYDYDRRDKNGNPRELHTELATDVINFCE